MNNTNENYLMINGKRVDLTDEQIEKLGLKTEKKDCFAMSDEFYEITTDGTVHSNKETGYLIPNYNLYQVANYCTDKKLMQQRALHETLSRLLWRFSMQNDGDKIDWNNNDNKYFIYYNSVYNEFDIDTNQIHKYQDIYFYTKEIAQRAIDEIVLPFIKEHKKFVW